VIPWTLLMKNSVGTDTQLLRVSASPVHVLDIMGFHCKPTHGSVEHTKQICVELLTATVGSGSAKASSRPPASPVVRTQYTLAER